MTEVKIYGYLSKIFGSSFKFYLGKVNDVIKAIDSIKNGFRQKLIELQKNGFIYSIQINKNIINIIPLINGSGGVSKTFAKVFSIVLIVVGVVLCFVPGFQSLGLSLITSGIQSAMTAFAKFPSLNQMRNDPLYQSSGGGTFSMSGGRSYIFSNKQNTATQGGIIKIGYGQIRIGSSLINFSVENNSTNYSFES